MGRAALEDGLQAWAAAASGLPAGSVIWANQPVKMASPYLSLVLQGPRSLSPVPERWQEFDAEAAPGQEIVHSARDTEEWSLLIQAHTKATTGDGIAADLLKKLKDSLKLDGTVATLRAAGVSNAVVVGDIQNVPAVIETEWRGRATMSVRFHTADVSTERTTYVETVDGAGEDDLTGVTI